MLFLSWMGTLIVFTKYSYLWQADQILATPKGFIMVLKQETHVVLMVLALNAALTLPL